MFMFSFSERKISAAWNIVTYAVKCIYTATKWLILKNTTLALLGE